VTFGGSLSFFPFSLSFFLFYPLLSSFGMTLFELVIRKVPFPEIDVDGFLIAHISDGNVPELPDQTPIDWQRAMKRCWANYGERPTAEQLAKVFDE
jgi:hypothetical protein